MEKPRCQSCGMPLGTPGFYGTNADATENKDYCKFCFQNGSYTQPELTVDDMVNRSVEFMSANLGFTKEKAEEMSRAVIPGLRRWTQ